MNYEYEFGSGSINYNRSENYANFDFVSSIGNQAGFELPETGGRGTWGYRVSGILLILSAIHLLKRKS